MWCYACHVDIGVFGGAEHQCGWKLSQVSYPGSVAAPDRICILLLLLAIDRCGVSALVMRPGVMYANNILYVQQCRQGSAVQHTEAPLTD